MSIWILMKQDITGGSGISWTIHKSFASHSRQDNHASTSSFNFYRLVLFLTPKPEMETGQVNRRWLPVGSGYQSGWVDVM